MNSEKTRKGERQKGPFLPLFPFFPLSFLSSFLPLSPFPFLSFLYFPFLPSFLRSEKNGPSILPSIPSFLPSFIPSFPSFPILSFPFLSFPSSIPSFVTDLRALKLVNQKINFLTFDEWAIRYNEVFAPAVPLGNGYFSDIGHRFRYNDFAR